MVIAHLFVVAVCTKDHTKAPLSCFWQVFFDIFMSMFLLLQLRTRVLYMQPEGKWITSNIPKVCAVYKNTQNSWQICDMKLVQKETHKCIIIHKSKLVQNEAHKCIIIHQSQNPWQICNMNEWNERVPTSWQICDMNGSTSKNNKPGTTMCIQCKHQLKNVRSQKPFRSITKHRGCSQTQFIHSHPKSIDN